MIHESVLDLLELLGAKRLGQVDAEDFGANVNLRTFIFGGPCCLLPL